MMKESFNWSTFVRKMYLNAPVAEVYQMWVNPKNITKFWLSDAEYDSEKKDDSEKFPEAGDNYIWKFYSGLVMRGKILEVLENECFKFTFGNKYQGSEEEKVIVTIYFTEETDNKTKIEIIQENIGEDEYGQVHYYLSCQLGWSSALHNLKSVMENSFDLREKDVQKAIETVGINDLTEYLDD